MYGAWGSTTALPSGPSGAYLLAIPAGALRERIFACWPAGCRKGISHSPEEYASPDDVAAATIALRDFMQAQWRQGEAAAAARDEL